MEQFKIKFGDKMRYVLLKMTISFKEKKYSECEKLLIELVEDAQSSPIIRLYLIQVLLLQGKTTEAIEHFKKISGFNEYKLGIVCIFILSHYYLYSYWISKLKYNLTHTR